MKLIYALSFTGLAFTSSALAQTTYHVGLGLGPEYAGLGVSTLVSLMGTVREAATPPVLYG